MATRILAEKSASTTPRAGDPRAICELKGELGERGHIARHAAIEIAQAAGTVRDIIDSDCEPADRNRVVSHLLRRIEALGYVVLSCVEDDDTMVGLWDRLGMEREEVL